MNGPRLAAREFAELRKLIRDVAGINLGDTKQELVAGRLGPRLRRHGLSTFTEYLGFIAADSSGAELRELVNAMTTNKTSFFREPHHFETLKNKIVPEIVARAAVGGRKRIRIWSAGCSTGQEPWTIAMTVAEALGSLAGWDVRILASDLDTNVLATAERATYDEIATADIPGALQSKYLEPASGGRRIIAPLRTLVTFRRINLVEPKTWSIRTTFDVVFCRNVAIYFDRPTQETVFRGLASLLEPTGYLMSGHSENLHWLSHVIRPVGNTVHVLANAGAAASVEAPESSGRVASAPVRGKSVAPRRLVSVPCPPRNGTQLRNGHATSISRRGGSEPGAQKRPLALDRPRLSLVAPSKGEVSIQVGGIHASAKGAVIRTTLGSCVAACLYDPEARIGGMNHFLLPTDQSGIRGPTNFGVHAMEILINAVMKLGGDRRRFVAKLFGGADQHIGGTTMVGRSNVEFATRFLEEENIPIIAQKVGGHVALAVVFDTSDGKVRVKTLERAPEVTDAEYKYVGKLAAQTRAVDDDIIIFGTP